MRILPSGCSSMSVSSPPNVLLTMPVPPPKPGSRPPGGAGVVQVTWMLVTLALPMMPLPLAMVHTCTGSVGCSVIVTSYGEPLCVGSVNVKAPLSGVSVRNW